MPRRLLLSGEEPGTAIGAVSFYDDTLVLEGAAESVLGTLAERMGPEEFGAAVMADGWSNGYLWLGEVIEDGGEFTSGE